MIIQSNSLIKYPCTGISNSNPELQSNCHNQFFDEEDQAISGTNAKREGNLETA